MRRYKKYGTLLKPLKVHTSLHYFSRNATSSSLTKALFRRVAVGLLGIDPGFINPKHNTRSSYFLYEDQVSRDNAKRAMSNQRFPGIGMKLWLDKGESGGAKWSEFKFGVDVTFSAC